MIALVDYGTGNIRSVANALKRLGARLCADAVAGLDFCVTDDPEVIRRADHVILPGVGDAARAMEQLRLKGLDAVIPSLSCPVLGICVGMQLMCRRSSEGNVDCLGIFPADVLRLPAAGRSGSSDCSGSFGSSPLKIPHVGWNTVVPVAGLGDNAARRGGTLSAGSGDAPAGLFRGIAAGTYFYYVHSYAAQLCPSTAAVTEYGVRFSAAMTRDNFFGTQFHPEKSGPAGSRLLRNFLEL